MTMNRCCLCNAEFSANFKGASLAPHLKDARLCLKCAHAVRILTKFDAKDQDTYEENFYYLHKKLIINKYPKEITQILFDILKDITTYGEYLQKKSQLQQ